ncbi:MAG: M18 family aminopeptidase [Clostridia bacterium]|nr:M18 family aminopeptidase [Clostridia bacterium]
MENRLFEFIEKSPTAFHTAATLARRLTGEGYTELYEGDGWELKDGGRYFMRRGSSSLIAFRYNASAGGFVIAASHSDTPAFRIKASPELAGAYNRADVEKYGGPILYSWLDRPLSVAGRVFVRTEAGARELLVNVERDLFVIPSVAIHLNRGVNDGYKFNPAVDMLPLFSKGNEKGALLGIVAEAAGVCPTDIISHDLFLYNRMSPTRFGAAGEFIASPRIDDLASVFATAEGFLTAAECNSLPVLAVFDNEEVGSSTREGAASSLLISVLTRIAGERLPSMLAGSVMASVDNAHALHPNHPELSDKENAPLLAGGVVIKHNAQQRYATDGVSEALIRLVAERAGVPLQDYHNRADIPGGSTLGTIADVLVPIPTADIGLPQLAMHSSVECAALEDINSLITLCRALFSSEITARADALSLSVKL